MTNIDNQRLLQPTLLTGPAVDRVRAIKDKNNAEKTDEELWAENGRRLDAEISDIEKGFFATFKSRIDE